MRMADWFFFSDTITFLVSVRVPVSWRTFTSCVQEDSSVHSDAALTQ